MRELGLKRFITPILDLDRLAGAPRGYARFAADLRRYRRIAPGEVSVAEAYPQIHDRTATSRIGHYFHQDVWAAQRVAELGPARHVDIGSRLDYVGFLTAVTSVVFVDIRPLEADVDGLESVAGSVLDLPFEDGSLESVSCLHVAEHIGLGRYGDPLDPDGTRKAATEIERVLAPGAQLLFAMPVGRPRTCFNAHRVHAPQDVLAMFPALELVEFSGVDDGGQFRRHRRPEELAGALYACGLFRFIRSREAA